MPGTSDEPSVLSRGAYERLKAELEELQTDGRKGVAERLQRARELGDLSENAEYHATKDEQALMESRIRKLEHVLRTAQVVDAPVKTDAAIAGTMVTLKPLDDADAEEELYLLAASSHERATNARTVTVQSPLGQALNGKHVGDVVEYQAPGGTFSYEVVKVDPWDGA